MGRTRGRSRSSPAQRRFRDGAGNHAGFSALAERIRWSAANPSPGVQNCFQRNDRPVVALPCWAALGQSRHFD